MLDTDTVSYALKGEGDVGAHLVQRRPAELCMSSISLSELRFGADARRSRRLHGLIDNFVASVRVAPFGGDEAAAFGKLASHLVRKGTPIGQFDTLIAAHALALGVTLVTNNTRHFSQVPKLRLENWY